MGKTFSSEDRLRLIALAQENLGGKASKESQNALNILYESVIPAIRDAMHRFEGLMYKNIDPQFYYDACSDGAINAILTYKPECGFQFSTYLFHQMRYSVLKLNRDNKLKPQIGVGPYFTDSIYDPIAGNEFLENSLTIEQTLIDPEYFEEQSIRNSEILLNKLTKLISKQYIDYIYLSELENLSSAEIAEIYGSKRSTVSMVIKVSRDKIKKIMTLTNSIKKLQANGYKPEDIKQSLNISDKDYNYYSKLYDYLYHDGEMPEPELSKIKQEMVNLVKQNKPVFSNSALYMYNYYKFIEKKSKQELDSFAKNSHFITQSNLDIVLKCRLKRLAENAETVYKISNQFRHNKDIVIKILETDPETLNFYLDLYNFNNSENIENLPDPEIARKLLDNKVKKFLYNKTAANIKHAINYAEDRFND